MEKINKKDIITVDEVIEASKISDNFAIKEIETKSAPLKKIKKKKFPVGIFLILLIIGSFIAAGAILAYFIYTGSSKIEDIEKNKFNFSVTLTEAFANVAELSFRKKKFSGLKSLLRKSIQENSIDEAFFVLNNGKLIAHSDKETERSLNGNLANDEFSYNLDLILAPSNRKSRNTNFTDYNIIKIKPPFPRMYKKLLKKYLYKKINSTGWLINRAVFVKGKPVGTVNVIISKEEIYRFIQSHIDECGRFLIISLSAAFILSLFMSIIVLVRYRSIQKAAMKFGAPDIVKSEKENDFITIELLADTDNLTDESDKDILIGEKETTPVKVQDMDSQILLKSIDDSEFDTSREIRDAIPIRRKE